MSNSTTQLETRDNGGDDAMRQEWADIRNALHGLRFGQVTITLQDGVIVQIDRLEKRRISREARGRVSKSSSLP